MIFFGIFFKLLIKTVVFILFDELLLVFGDDSFLIGDLFTVFDVVSSFIEGFPVDFVTGFFVEFVPVDLDGDGIISFFSVETTFNDVFTSVSCLIFNVVPFVSLIEEVFIDFSSTIDDDFICDFFVFIVDKFVFVVGGEVFF